MKLMPIKENEKLRIACLVDDIDKAIARILYLFGRKVVIKTVVHNCVCHIIVY